MAKEKEAEGYETTEYGSGEDKTKKFSLIQSIVQYKQRNNPTFGINVSFQSEGLLTFKYHVYEMDLPNRIRIVQEEADQRLDAFVKELKKEYKERGGGTLDLKEKKEARSVSNTKVSLNERYYFVYVRLYDFE